MMCLLLTCKGLIAAMAQLKMDFAKQIWILDNSGSMSVNDGNLLVGDSRFVRCSRWNELQSCVEAHIKLSGQLRFPTSFRVSLFSATFSAPCYFFHLEVSTSPSICGDNILYSSLTISVEIQISSVSVNSLTETCAMTSRLASALFQKINQKAVHRWHIMSE